MRIQISSDLHMEFLNRFLNGHTADSVSDHPICQRVQEHGRGLGFWLNKMEDIDVLVLPGDLYYIRDKVTFNALLSEALDFAREVIFVPGNHDFWGSTIDGGIKALKEAFAGTRIHILYNDEIELGGELFFGGTGWSRIRASKYRRFMNFPDFARIQDWDIDKFNQEHSDFVGAVRGSEAELIVSHFLPSTRSNHPRFNGSPFNEYFAADLDDLMRDKKLWIHGHTHDRFDYVNFGCRVVANPFGYAGSPEPNQGTPYDFGKVIEV